MQQIEPRIDLATVTGDVVSHHFITTPGSYYLSANLDVDKLAGIRASEGSTLTDCIVAATTHIGSGNKFGFDLGAGCTVSHCTACSGLFRRLFRALDKSGWSIKLVV